MLLGTGNAVIPIAVGVLATDNCEKRDQTRHVAATYLLRRHAVFDDSRRIEKSDSANGLFKLSVHAFPAGPRRNLWWPELHGCASRPATYIPRPWPAWISFCSHSWCSACWSARG
ncbi:MAG: hypothetical protein GPOALKHO_000652 [Sodalis sp.]|nr:MAG: hypothetical protein GPOALKHO_000652 [Sodalis sp.]